MKLNMTKPFLNDRSKVPIYLQIQLGSFHNLTNGNLNDRFGSLGDIQIGLEMSKVDFMSYDRFRPKAVIGLTYVFS